MSAKIQHTHPRRARKAARAARTATVLGILGSLVGFFMFLEYPDVLNGWPIALIPLGFTTVLLAAIAYFSYMETLEPQNYEHDRISPEN
jgi:hypothetical protein